MALARIITRSQTCSRELSLVLIERGYTVEIVSPDKVPTNIADLELRVDDGPGNQLLATVEAHGGDRTASLKFVHHLKAPMVDPVLRLAELDEAVEPVGLNTQSGIEFSELPAETSKLIPRPLSPALRLLPNRTVDLKVDLKGGAAAIRSQVLSLSLVKPQTDLAVEGAAVSAPTRPRITKAEPTIVLAMSATQRRERTDAGPRRAVLAFAALVVLAVILGFSVRGTLNSAVEVSAAPPSQRVAASTGVDSATAVGTQKMGDRLQISAIPWTLPAERDNSGYPPKDAPVANARISLSSRAAVSPRRGDDVVAPNTIIYFDKRYEPAPKNRRPQPKKKVRP
jgi:hypothetical protein